MSVHSAGWAPATRVASRKLGPVGGSVSPPSARVAWATRRLASTWGTCDTAAITRSCVAASMATGRAPSPVTRRCRRSSRTPEVPVVGVRYQVAPSNRSARACSTPAASLPASGWPPTNRGSPLRATTARLVEPTSVTAQPGGAAASTRATVSGRAPTGTATTAASAPASAVSRSSHASSIAPARSAAAARGSTPRTVAPRRRRGGRPTEPPINPTPTIATIIQWATGPAVGRRAASRGRRGGEERGLAGDGGGGLDALRVGGEVAGAQLLRPVADRLLGHRVDLDDDAVGAGRGGGQAERLDEGAPPRRVAGVDDHRQGGEVP